jgi:hypothetical protein
LQLLSHIVFFLCVQLVTAMLDMLGFERGTAEGLFNAVEQSFAANGLSFNNLLGYASDHANAVFGDHNSLKSRLLEKQPTMVTMGCVPHAAALIASHAFKSVPEFEPLEGFAQDLWNWFKLSSLRRGNLKAFQELEVGDSAAPAGRLALPCRPQHMCARRQQSVRLTL